MLTGHSPIDDLLGPAAPPRPSHPTDSSRVLLGLLDLSREAASEADVDPHDALAGIVSRSVLRRLLSALHHRDAGTVRHSRRVAQMAAGVGTHLGWEGRHLKVLEVAALLHDIGKIGVPDNVLFKPGRLSAEETELISLHHQVGIDVLQACRVGREVLEIVAQSRAGYGFGRDGSRRLGEELHQGARILAVVDAFDSLRNDQVYRAGMGHDEILRLLHEEVGGRYDANVVAAMSRWLDADGGRIVSQAGDGEARSEVDSRGPIADDGESAADSLCHIFNYLYVLESLYDGFYLVDSDMRFVVWNRGIEDLLGTPAATRIGQAWTSRTLQYADRYGEPLADRDCPVNQVLESGRPATRTVRLKTEDDEWLEVELQSVPLLDAEGRLHGAAEIVRDLTRGARRTHEYRELKLAASRDPLTGVANRGELETQLALLVSRHAKRTHREPLAVAFLDVDFFKSINDTHGHGIGDQVLIDLARLLDAEVGSTGLVGRYGGEEFLVVLPDTDLARAVKRAEGLRLAIARRDLGGLGRGRTTSSLGVAAIEEGDSVESLVRRADKALYKAKQSGRNRTCAYTATDLQAETRAASAAPSEFAEPFLLSTRFRACIAADLVVYKLGGFVDDQKGRLLDVGPRKAVIRLGRSGLLPLWGAEDDRRPVDLHLEIGAEEPVTRAQRVSSRQVTIDVRIRPAGWVRDQAAFRDRALRVFKLLRSYFAASD